MIRDKLFWKWQLPRVQTMSVLFITTSFYFLAPKIAWNKVGIHKYSRIGVAQSQLDSKDSHKYVWLKNPKAYSKYGFCYQTVFLYPSTMIDDWPTLCWIGKSIQQLLDSHGGAQKISKTSVNIIRIVSFLSIWNEIIIMLTR